MKAWKDIARDPLPSFSKMGTQVMSWFLLVNGAAIEASVFEILMPTAAVLSALQSLAPSPTIATWLSSSYSISISLALSSGDMLA